MHKCGDSTLVVHPLFQEEEDGSIPISPLQLQFDMCSLDTAIRLNRAWHSVFPIASYSNMIRGGRLACYVATYKNRYYATAIWTRPIAANRMKDGDRLIELRRLAISDDSPKNTASRFLSYMAKHIRKTQPDVLRMISYQDTKHHNGTIYKASGWQPVSVSSNADWSIHKRPGLTLQSDSPKIRWEFKIS